MDSYRTQPTTNPDALAAAAETEAEARNSRSPGDPPSPEMEATAEALTREEVLRRRRRRAARLAGVYRGLYWAMAEEVRSRHRQYVWDLGRSPLEAEQPLVAGGAVDAPRPGPGTAAVPRRKKCGSAGCKVRAMPMAGFCHSHILYDPNQMLYKGCAFVIKSMKVSNHSSTSQTKGVCTQDIGAQIKQIACSRPILKASVPSLCNVHLQRTQKNIAQAYKKVGFNPPPTGRISPNFSVLVAECVRQIQAKRRESQSTAAQKICPKDGKVD